MVVPRRCSAVALAVLAVAASGCAHTTTSGAGESESVARTTTITMPAPTQTDVNNNGIPDSETSDTDWPGTMRVTYEDATTPEAIAGRQFMQDNNLLDHLADDINSTLRLPYDVTLTGSECGEPNDYWSSTDNTVTMCYEDASNSLDVFAKLGDADPEKATFHTELEAFYHEAGHMVISLYDLPATGREEDVADQASIYLLFRPDAEGNIDPDSIEAIRDTARWYQESSAEDDDQVTDEALADVHSPNKARMYNFECWAYGADPQQGADLVGEDKLPEDRASGCEDEYAQLERAWGTLLEPYLKTG